MDMCEQPRCALALLLLVPAESLGKEEVRRESGIGAGQRASSTLVWLVNTHLSHKVWSGEHRRQARELLDWVDALAQAHPRAAVVLAGDLNAPPWLPGVRPLAAPSLGLPLLPWLHVACSVCLEAATARVFADVRRGLAGRLQGRACARRLA
jgi:endonuclease/exonuclease/phosphatase family metal-dependent hydrolase